MTNACPVLSVRILFLSQLVFQRKGSFLVSWVYLEARPESSVCHSFLFLIWHVPLQDFIPVANQWLQSGVWPQDGERENGSTLLKNTTAVEVDTFLKRKGLISAPNVSFICDCCWQLHMSVVQSQVGNETFWIPSDIWSSLDLLDQRFRVRYWDPCLVLSWVSEIKGS